MLTHARENADNLPHPIENEAEKTLNRFWFMYWLETYIDKLIGGFDYSYTPGNTSEHLEPDIDFLHWNLPLYALYMEYVGLIDKHDFDFNKQCRNNEIAAQKGTSTMRERVKSAFTEKTVYFIPGRTGQVAYVAHKEWGTNVGVVTDGRYFPGVLSMFTTGKLGNNGNMQPQETELCFLAEARVADLPDLLSKHHPHGAEIGRASTTNTKGKVWIPPKTGAPDIVISSNLFTSQRFTGEGNYGHIVGVTWKQLLARILSIGEPNKTVYLINPHMEKKLVCKKEEMILFLQEIPGLEFILYDPRRYNKSVSNIDVPNEFNFLVHLTQPVPDELL